MVALEASPFEGGLRPTGKVASAGPGPSVDEDGRFLPSEGDVDRAATFTRHVVGDAVAEAIRVKELPEGDLACRVASSGEAHLQRDRGE